jgi:hypothetical protein
VRPRGTPVSILVAFVVVAGCSSNGAPGVAPTPTPTPTQTLAVRSLKLSGIVALTAVGQSSQLAATATLSDGSVRDVTSASVWQTEPTAVVRLSATGLVTATSYGTARLWATYQGTASPATPFIVRVTDVPAQVPIDVSALSGAWHDLDRLNPAITRIEVGVAQGRIVVHAWGSCVPTDCDWGEASTDLSDATDGALSVTWSTGFSTVAQQYRLLQDGRLEITSHTHFTDASGRVDYDAVEYLGKS